MIEACLFHSLTRRLSRTALKTSGVVIQLETKLLIVGDSVMGCFIKRREMVMRLPTRFHSLVTRAPCSGNRPKPQWSRNTLIRAGSFAGPFLPATCLALP
jgi:hypothetical protein